jgi:hypothetical protein
MQLKTVVFELTDVERERLEPYLKSEYGGLLIPADFDPTRTTNGTRVQGEKSTYRSTLPEHFPMGAPDWVVAHTKGGRTSQ